MRISFKLRHIQNAFCVLMVICISVLIGCKKDPEATAKDALKTLLSRLRLPEDTKSDGTDPMGRYWLKIPVHGPDGKAIEHLYDLRVYDPEQQVLYRAKKFTKKDGKDDYTLTAIRRYPASGPDGGAPPQDSIEALKLGPNAEDQGLDDNGIHWFGVPAVDAEGRVVAGKADQLGFNTKSKILGKLVADEKGQKKLEPLAEQPK